MRQIFRFFLATLFTFIFISPNTIHASHVWGGGVLAVSAWGQTLTFSLYALLVFVIILAGLVGMARLALGAHTPADLYRGYGVGFGAVLLAATVLLPGG